MSLLISNRRYIGSKTDLLENIHQTVMKYYQDYDFTFMDPFGGTGVVANFFADKGCRVIVNDMLFSNYIAYRTWISNDVYDLEKVKSILAKYNAIKASELADNYFSKTFGDKYYHVNDAKKIGYIREMLQANKDELTEREYFIVLTSLLYAADRIAHTCGHFESYLKSTPPREKGVDLRCPVIADKKQESIICCEDANALVRTYSADVVYIDPPYNARQYVNFYHVLENLALWEKPVELEGDSMKFKRNHLKSAYSRSSAPMVFADLINNIKAKIIIVSYNNTYTARSTASNNKISEGELFDILCRKGKTTKYEIDHKFFNAGKTDFKNHKELIFVCEVNNG